MTHNQALAQRGAQSADVSCPKVNTFRKGDAVRMIDDAAILIVEDDADVQRAARIALAESCKFIEVLDRPDTLASRIEAVSFDVVLLDMNFVVGDRSGSTGLDALGRLQELDAGLAVVLMTAYGGVSLAVEALKHGATDFVLKPWRNDKLVATVRAAATATRRRRAVETLNLDTLERAAIERALVQHGGNISLAAAALGLSRPALYRRMSKHGL
jgi:two-component system response regulator RegA